MLKSNIEKIKNEAQLIVSGYAFLPREDGSSVMQKRGDLTDSEITTIQKFIKENYIDMYKTRKDFGGKEFYRK